jgi:hypothetical protein
MISGESRGSLYLDLSIRGIIEGRPEFSRGSASGHQLVGQGCPFLVLCVGLFQST